MAEQTVLAEFSVDSEGVIQGIDSGNEAMQRGEIQLGKLANSQLVVQKSSGSLVGGLFKLVVAVSAITKIMAFFNITLNATKLAISTTTVRVLALSGGLGGLGALFAGITAGMIAFIAAVAAATAAIAALTALLGGLVLQIIKNTDWWKRGAEAIGDWHARLVAGEDALGQMGRRLAGFSGESAGALLLRLRELTEQTDSLNDSIKQIEGGRSNKFNAVMRGFEGIMIALHGVDRSGEATAKALRLGLEDTALATDEVVRKLLEMKFTIDQLRKATGKPLVEPAALAEAATPFLPTGPLQGPKDAPGALGILTSEEFAAAFAAIQDDARALNAIFGQGERIGGQYAIAVENLTGRLLDLGIPIGEVRSLLEGMGVQLQEVFGPQFQGTVTDGLESMNDQLQLAAVNMEIMTSATQALGQALATSLAEGGRGMRQSIAKALKDLAIFYGVQALAQLAMGIAASTPWGQALGMGPPSVYFQAAGKFAAAAAAATIGSAALGGGGGAIGGTSPGGGRGGASSGQPVPLEPDAGGGSRSVHIEVHGSLIGSDPDELARSLFDLLAISGDDGKSSSTGDDGRGFHSFRNSF